MRLSLGWAVYSDVTKKFIVLDTNSGGYPVEADKPFPGAMAHGGIWTKGQAEKEISDLIKMGTYIAHAATYRAVEIFAEI